MAAVNSTVLNSIVFALVGVLISFYNHKKRRKYIQELTKDDTKTYLKGQSQSPTGICLSWKPTNTTSLSSGLVTIDFNFKSSWFNLQGPCGVECSTSRINTLGTNIKGHWKCFQGCSSEIDLAPHVYTVTSATEQGEGSFTYTFNSLNATPIVGQSFDYSKLVFYYASSSLRHAFMKVITILHLGTRSDTLTVNRSPLTMFKGDYRLRYGRSYHLKIPISDSDGDTVKCRWATGESTYGILDNGFDCDFDTYCPGWSNDPTADYKWARFSGSGSLISGPASPSSGSFYIHLNSKSRTNDTHRYVSPIMQNHGLHCLYFWYSMYGADIGTFNVYMNSAQILSRTGQQNTQRKWLLAEIAINATADFKIVFEAIHWQGSSSEGYTALDTVMLRNGSCSTGKQVANGFDCDFDIFCADGWENGVVFSDYNWTVTEGQNNATDSAFWGNNYLCMNSRLPNVTETGAKAWYISPSVNIPGSQCLQFRYHMKQLGIGSLNVYMNTTSTWATAWNGSNMVQHPIWSKSGQQSDYWLTANIQLEPTDTFNLIFEGIHGNGTEGEISIDLILLKTGQCIIDECGGLCKTLANAQLTEDCELHISNVTEDNGFVADDIYAVTIQIEDFARNNITVGNQAVSTEMPLSSVPLLISFQSTEVENIDVRKPSFVDTGNLNETESVKPIATYENTLCARAEGVKSISYIDIVGPPGLLRVSETTYLRVPKTCIGLAWTPTSKQSGVHWICFSAADDLDVESETFCKKLYAWDLRTSAETTTEATSTKLELTSPTTSLGSTTYASTTTTGPLPLVQVGVQLNIREDQGHPAVFTPSLNDPNTTEYKRMARVVVNALQEAVLNSPYGAAFNSCVVLGFSQGSILANVHMTFLASSVSPPILETSILKNWNISTPPLQIQYATVVDFNECQSRNTNYCSKYATCQNSNGGYSCTCKGGYVDNSTSVGQPAGWACSKPCLSITCQNQGTCKAVTDGDPFCECLPGYTGNICELYPGLGRNNGAILAAGLVVGILIVTSMFLSLIYLAQQKRQGSRKWTQSQRHSQSESYAKNDPIAMTSRHIQPSHYNLFKDRLSATSTRMNYLNHFPDGICVYLNKLKQLNEMKKDDECMFQ